MSSKATVGRGRGHGRGYGRGYGRGRGRQSSSVRPGAQPKQVYSERDQTTSTTTPGLKHHQPEVGATGNTPSPSQPRTPVERPHEDAQTPANAQKHVQLISPTSSQQQPSSSLAVAKTASTPSYSHRIPSAPSYPHGAPSTPTTTPARVQDITRSPQTTSSHQATLPSAIALQPPSSSHGDSKEPNPRGKPQPPERPGFGTKGRQIMVRANFFPVKLPRHLTIHQYDVSINPPAKYPKWMCKLIFRALQKKYSDSVFVGQMVAFDGSKNIYSHKQLQLKNGDNAKLSVDVEIPGETRERNFTITLKYATSMNIDMNKIEAVLRNETERMPLIQALDIVMRHLPSMRWEPIGRSFFTKPENPFTLGQGLEVWPGYYQSLRPTIGWKFKLNLDTSSTVFYTEQTVIDFMCTLFRGSGGKDATRPLTDADRHRFTSSELRDFDRKRLDKEIKGLKVQVTHLPYPRKYNVLKVTRDSAERQTFPLDNGEKCTVANYFSKHHHKTLQYPHLPCLHVGQKNRNVYIPLEYCLIVGGQRCTRKLNELQTSNMIRAVTKPAYEREREIKQKVRESGIVQDPVIKDFGITVSDKMVTIPARVLEPPPLNYNCGQTVRPPPDKGSWDVRGRFYEGATVNRYAVLVLSRYVKDEDVEKFTSMLEKTGRQRGMIFKGDKIVKFHNPHARNAESMEAIFKDFKTKVNLIIPVIDKGPLYSEIKRIGDTLTGVATQCVLSNTMQQKCNQPTIGNICLKINPKLGGINNVIRPDARLILFQKEPVIVFGADVTHPKAGDTTTPSIAAVVASMDLTASKFKGKHHVQKHRQEMIADLKEMAKGLLKDFHRETRQKPTRIIFYRDGVSEGQFGTIRIHEIYALQQACVELEKGYEPGITFVVCQKRHHTRLFPVNREDAGAKGNVPPGTVVEKEITHPYEFDFYLCSHAAIQGTSRPCHYYVLWDDNNFTADDLQTLSYQLCHTFWRCNRSVSYPAPAYYAHRAAYHARMLFQASEDQWSSNGGSIASGSVDMGTMDEAIAIHMDRSGDMYFM